MAPAGLVALLQAYASADDAIKQREAVFASEMRATALQERDALLQVRNALAAAADGAEHEYLESGSCGPALQELTDNSSQLRRAALLNAAGRTVCGTAGWSVATDLPQWPEFVRWPRPMFSLKTDTDPTGSWSVVALHPTVFNREAAFAVAAEVDLTHLRALSVGNPNGRIYGVADSRGTMIADSGGEGTDWLPEDVGALLGSFERAATASSERGNLRLYITQPLIEGQLWAVGSVPKATVTDVLFSRDGLTVLAPVVLWVIAVVVAYVAIDKLVTPHIARLHRATARIGRGDLDVDVRSTEAAPAEIRALGDAIRDMARNLQDRDADLHDLIERQKSLILEIHHRVKNNLQMVTSLINIQLRRANTADEHEALRFLEDRIQSLALVHHHLYGSEELDRIPLDDLVRDICERLKLSMTPVGARVDFRYALDHLIVDPRIATPVALFLTEAVSNAFKHAVTQTGEHEIDVALRTDGHRFTLEVRNRLADADAAEPRGEQQRLGMRLLRSFAAQLDGSFDKIVDAESFRLVLTAPVAPRGSAAAPSGDNSRGH